jgi:hypothetical protein
LINISANEGQVDPSASFASAERGLEIAERAGDLEGVSFLLGNACEGAIHLARWDWIKEKMAYLEEGWREGFVAGAVASFAVAAAYMGDLEDARRRLADFEAQVLDSSALQERDAIAVLKSTIAFIEGDLEAAREALTTDSFGAISGAAPFGIVGRVALWRKDLAEAKHALKIEEDSTLRNPWQRTRVTTLQAGIAALEGRKDDALALYKEAILKWDSLENPLGKAMCQMDMVFLVGGPEADEARAGAEAFFTEAGNELMLERLREGLAA